MTIVLQNKMTLDYVQSPSQWTSHAERALVFASGLEAIYFCFNHHIGNMQIVGNFKDNRMNFTVQVTDPL